METLYLVLTLVLIVFAYFQFIEGEMDLRR